MFDVEGRIACVTGASSGLGRAAASFLAERGARVVGVARRSEQLADWEQECPGQTATVTADLGELGVIVTHDAEVGVLSDRGEGEQEGGENRQQEIALISRSLKNLARELQVPVIAVSQLNRSLESREDKRPRLGDLRESGAIEQDADVVLFIYRDEAYNPDKVESKGIAEVVVAKHRQGAVGKVQMTFLPEFTLFADMGRDVPIA